MKFRNHSRCFAHVCSLQHMYEQQIQIIISVYYFSPAAPCPARRPATAPPGWWSVCAANPWPPLHFSAYRFDVSLDGNRWNTVSQGEFSNIKNNPVEQVVSFNDTQARFFRLTALENAEGNANIGYEYLAISFWTYRVDDNLYLASI